MRQRLDPTRRPDGSASALLGSAWDVYYLWLDQLIGGEPAVIVNESKSTARFMSRYVNPRTTLIHQFHESHLAHEAGEDPYKGTLGQAHRRILPHLDRFDAVVFLTEQQRRRPAMQIGVEQHGMPPRFLPQMPGEVGGERGRPDPAADARDGDDAPAAQMHVARRRTLSQIGQQVARHHLLRQRLEQVFQHAEPTRQLPVEGGVLPFTDDEDAHGGP